MKTVKLYDGDHYLREFEAEVVAVDFSAEMIAHARRRTTKDAERITYHVVDATDEAALLSLGEGRFDAALCNMALFDMAEIGPLMRALPMLLRPGGRFVFSVIHPCFNNSRMAQVARGVAIAGQPQPQLYFHRPLQVLLGAAFDVGFVLDGLAERAFPPDHPAGSTPLSWGGNFSEIPPVLVVRLRLRS